MLAPILLSVFLADPTPQQIELLKTFRTELIAITPGEGGFPAKFAFQDAAKESSAPAAFRIGRYEVPQNLWEAVMGSNPSKWKGKRNSVEMLSLEEAEAFCETTTSLMRAAKLIEPSEVVRLPTELEWEYAARAGTDTTYSFGDDVKLLDQYGWHTGNAAGNDPPVGAKKPNPWGLYDVHGYLWEWVSGSARENVDLKKAVVRGGSWKETADQLTSSSRREVDPKLRDDAVGLRCVVTLVGAGAVPAVAAPAASAPDEFVPTAQEKVVPANSKLEKLWDDGEFTEGPALAPDGSIFFSDIGTTIYRYDPKQGTTSIFRRPSGRSNGLKFDQQGALIACEGANTGGNRRISITTGIRGATDGKVETLADRFDGKRFNSPNDLAIDPEGRVYFTDPRYVGNDPRELDFEGVFVVERDGAVRIATRDVQKPNGIIAAPSGKIVYVADNNPQGHRHLNAFAAKSDGTLGERRILHDFGPGRGIDGMTLDKAGNIYATAGTGDKGGIYVFSSEGKSLAFITTPGDPTNCCFGGGDESSTLYITSANSKEAATKYGLYRIKLNAAGYHVVKLK